MTRPRLLGIQIAFGFTPEAKVFANLLHESSEIDARVVFQESPATPRGALQFQTQSGVAVTGIDFGWRPGTGERPHSAKTKLTMAGRFLLALKQLERVAREFSPDVVYSSQQRWDCLAAAFVAKRLSIPQVIHLHYTVGPWLGRLALMRLRSSDQVITVSDFIRDQAVSAGIDPRKVVSVRNAIALPSAPEPSARNEVRAELGIPADAIVAGMVARMDLMKRPLDTLRAFEQVAGESPSGYLVFVGNGPDSKEVERAVQASRYSERLRFLGFRSDVPRLLSSFDFFVHPSQLDPCPLAVLEAQAAGLPVVAYNEGGIPEIVARDRTGLLAPTGDVQALGDHIYSLFTDGIKRGAMQVASRSRIERDFRPEEASSQFERIIRNVASARSSGATRLPSSLTGT